MSDDFISSVTQSDGIAAKWRQERESKGGALSESDDDQVTDMTAATLSQAIVQESARYDPIPVQLLGGRGWVLREGRMPQKTEDLRDCREVSLVEGAEGEVTGYLFGGLPIVRLKNGVTVLTEAKSVRRS